MLIPIKASYSRETGERLSTEYAEVDSDRVAEAIVNQILRYTREIKEKPNVENN